MNNDLNVIESNVEAIHKLRVESDRKRRRDHILIDEIAAFVGSTTSLYAHFFIYGVWMLIHFTVTGTSQFLISTQLEDISLVATLEAIFLALFVLINQRRMNAVERRHSDLDLQMSLLVEQEVTRIARATSLIAQKLGVDTAAIIDLEKAGHEVKPSDVLEKISDVENKTPTHLTKDNLWKKN